MPSSSSLRGSYNPRSTGFEFRLDGQLSADQLDRLSMPFVKFAAYSFKDGKTRGFVGLRTQLIRSTAKSRLSLLDAELFIRERKEYADVLQAIGREPGVQIIGVPGGRAAGYLSGKPEHRDTWKRRAFEALVAAGEIEDFDPRKMSVAALRVLLVKHFSKS